MMNTETKNLKKIEIFNTRSINQKCQYSQKQTFEITQKGKAKEKRCITYWKSIVKFHKFRKGHKNLYGTTKDHEQPKTSVRQEGL